MKADTYTMILTNKYSGEKMKVEMIIEPLVGDAAEEVFGHIQNNFLWEAFDFEVRKEGTIEVDDDEPINTYGDVQVLR